jgi:hypothetical protein
MKIHPLPRELIIEALELKKAEIKSRIKAIEETIEVIEESVQIKTAKRKAKKK